MKKMILVLFGCLTLVVFQISFSMVEIEYRSKLPILNKVEESLYLNLEEVDNSSVVLNDLLAFCQKENISFIKHNITSDENNYLKYVYTNDPHFYKSIGVDFQSDELNLFNKDAKLFLSNDASSHPYKVLDFFPTTLRIEIRNFADLDAITLGGEYQVMGSQSELFLNYINQHYPELVLDQRMLSFDSLSYIDQESIRYFLFLGLLIAIITSICLLIHYGNHEREIAIYKLNGYSPLKILVKENKKLLFSIIGIILIIDVIMVMFRVPYWNVYTIKLWKLLMFGLLAMLLFFLFAQWILYVFFQKVSITSLLKYERKKRGLFFINMTLRFIVILVSVSFISNEFTTYLQDFDVLWNYPSFQDEIKHYSYLKGNQKNYSMEEQRRFHDVYRDFVTAKGAIGIQNDPYFVNMMSGSQNTLPFIYVNQNYINNMEIKTEDGKKLFVDVGDENTLYIPKQLSTNQYHMDDSLMELKDTLYLEEHQMFQVFDNQAMVNHHIGYLEDVALLLIDKISTDALYFDDRELSYSEIEAYLKKQGFDVNLLFEKASDKNILVYYDVRERFLSNTVLFIGMIVSISTVALQTILLYLEEAKKEIIVKRFHGFSLWKRYDGLFLSQTIFYVIMLVLGIISRNITTINIIVGMFVMEILFTTVLLLMKDRKSIASLIKK